MSLSHDRSPSPWWAVVLALTVSPPATAGEVRVGGRPFTLPDGFVIERVAGPPLVDRPVVADFDDEGRLYVADSSGSNDRVEKQLVDTPHKILRLEDSDGDGVFDRRTVFADKVMFPAGAMWLDGSLYVSAPPSIWKFTDADGDGVAEKREEWFKGKTLTGCANDLHGPYAGPDGWVYWCKGAFARQTYDRPGKTPFVTRAAHIFRCRPDGSGIEAVMTGGMDNPVDVVFTPGGERIFTTTFLQHPAGGKRDGLIHAVYGGVYGKVHDVIDGHPRTGPEVMPVLSHLGPAAPCGLVRYEAEAFGPEYRDDLFACDFNLQKISRHTLTPDGATFTSKDADFLVSTDRDFHPTDIVDDADGSLLVIDTGGWYKLCCPTSQLSKPDVLGTIYRVRRADAAKVDDPRGLRLDWKGADPKALAARLDDPRPAVRRRAIGGLAKLGAKAVPAIEGALKPGRSVEARRNAVWAATRIDGPDARAAARRGLADFDETVRQVAAHSASVRLDRGALPKLLDLLESPSAQNRRAAAEAVGRLGDAAAIPALLTAAGQADSADRVLQHSLTYALIEVADPDATRTALLSANPQSRRAALIALDQMGTDLLKPEDVAPGLASGDPATRETASWVLGRHPAWGEALAGFFRDRLDARDLTDSDRNELAGQLARLAGSGPVQTLLADRLKDAATPAPTRGLVLRAMAESGLKAPPGSWASALKEALRADPETVRGAVSTARALNTAAPKFETPELADALTTVGGDKTRPDAVRVDALAALAGGLAKVDGESFRYLVERLGPDNPAAVRGAAAGVLGRATLSPEQLSRLADAVRTVGPLEVDRLLPAFEKSGDDALGLKLLAALRDSPALGALRVDMLKPRVDKFGPKVRAEAESLYAALNVDAAKQRARLDALLPTLADGDVRRGQLVFNSAKSACVSCHAVGYLGGKVGPDLTSIGKVRGDRDLLESILYPSLSFVRSYEPMTVATADGKVVSGILKKDAPDEVVLAVNANDEARVPRDQIEEMKPGSVSVMPAGLEQQLTRQELADLLAFLKSRK